MHLNLLNNKAFDGTYMLSILKFDRTQAHCRVAVLCEQWKSKERKIEIDTDEIFIGSYF